MAVYNAQLLHAIAEFLSSGFQVYLSNLICIMLRPLLLVQALVGLASAAEQRMYYPLVSTPPPLILSITLMTNLLSCPLQIPNPPTWLNQAPRLAA